MKKNLVNTIDAFLLKKFQQLCNSLHSVFEIDNFEVAHKLCYAMIVIASLAFFALIFIDKSSDATYRVLFLITIAVVMRFVNIKAREGSTATAPITHNSGPRILRMMTLLTFMFAIWILINHASKINTATENSAIVRYRIVCMIVFLGLLLPFPISYIISIKPYSGNEKNHAPKEMVEIENLISQ